MVTKEQLQNISNRLTRWREERGLTKESQIVGISGNFYEEVTELHRAKTVDEKVDAYCDMFIYLANTFGVDDYDKIVEKSGVSCLMLCPFEGVLESYNYIMGQTLKKIWELGYDPYKAINEAITHIESRTGEWDNELKKWKKHKGAYTAEEAIEIAREQAIDRGYTIVGVPKIGYTTRGVLSVYDIPTNDIGSGSWFDVELRIEEEECSFQTYIKKWYKPEYESAKRDKNA